jgi:hypothetical protein
MSPNITDPGAVNGTATSLTIPAGTLAPGKTYSSSIGFGHTILTTNRDYVTYVYRATDSTFSLTTISNTVSAPVLTNAGWSGGKFGFDFMTSAGQTVTVVSTANPANALASWPIVLTTNSPGSSVHVIDPHSVTNPVQIYRARNGN